jgi:hypothetical protein
MKRSFHLITLTLFLLCAGAAVGSVARADVKIKTRSSSGGRTAEYVTYIKGKRQRAENNETSVTITQCDLRRTLQLGVPTKTYVAMPFGQKTEATTTPATPARDTAAADAARRGGIVTSTITATDTGERKKMFGYTARRIKTTMTTESSPDACQVSRSKMETDGWYIDAQFGIDCENAAASAYMTAAREGCRDEYRTKQLGTAKLGYPVMVTTTLFDENGNESFTFSNEVVEISSALLDNALFDVPADYRQVKDQAELYGAASATAEDDSSAANNNSALTGGKGAANSNSVVGAKREGVKRVGVALTKTLEVGDGVDPLALAEAARKRLLSSLSNPSIEIVALEARRPQEVEAEAREKSCDFILYSTVAHKKGSGGSGGFGSFLKKTASLTSVGAASANDEGNASGDAKVSLKAKDELTLEYRLQRGFDAVVTNTVKAKAKSSSDDVMSQLAMQAAASVLAAAASAK